MKILVMTTGGTIGSSYDGYSVNVNADRSTPVIEMYKREYSDADFDVISPLNILSESVEAKDLEALWTALSQVDFAAYEGVVLTCGSDTLAYLASFVGLLFAHCPIALVCANKILTAPDSNGYENFVAAVKILGTGFSKAFVPYRNSDGVMYVHSATEIRQADYVDDFWSLYHPCAVFDGEMKPMREYVIHTVPDGVFTAENPLRLQNQVMMIAPYPMIDYDAVCLDSCKAVLHLTYHSGTLNSDQAKRLIQKAGEIPVFLAPLKKGAKLYQTTADMLALGMKPLYDISPECAYLKLLLAVNQDQMSIDRFMEDET
ncbi:MAG: asparaginase [Ruminococcus sp.]|nr:asparaginase [Ruminococcus sp.]